MKKRAEKKIQIIIDKLIDLQEICEDDGCGTITRMLEKAREFESKIQYGKVKNNKLIL